jgi:SPP1 family predicted phage head-tail adaptor
MTIGELDRRISIYTVTDAAADKFGGKAQSEALLTTVWAKIDGAGGDEKKEGEKVTATSRCNFTIRYRTGLTEKMRIKVDSDTYYIKHIEETTNDRKRYLVISAEKKY